MNFNFQPALDFYTSLRKNGKKREEAFRETFDPFWVGSSHDFWKIRESWLKNLRVVLS